MSIGQLKNKKILILGFGREGMDNLIFLRKLFPSKVIGIGLSCICNVIEEDLIEDNNSHIITQKENEVVLEVLGDMLE